MLLQIGSENLTGLISFFESSVNPNPSQPPAKPKRISRNVWALGWVSFFGDLASEMLYPILPLFLVGTLGASPALLGFIEGLAEGVSSGLRWVGGALSDRYARRKPFVVWGYLLGALSKPIMGLAAVFGGWPIFLLGRLSDRFGKTIRTAARDALIADSTEPEYRGIAFGFHRTMDTCGAILGPLVALAAITIWKDFPLQWLFFIALVPGLICTLISALAVREVMHHPSSKPTGTVTGAQAFPKEFWLLLVGFGIFAVGNSSDSFLLLRTREIGLTFQQVILAYAVYNVIFAFTATPLGHLSDRIGRKPVIIAGWCIYAMVYAGFGFFHSTLAPWFLLASYGLYQALTDGVGKAMISDVAPAGRRAAAMGIFSSVSGLGQFAASMIAGMAWKLNVFGGRMMVPFLVGSICAAAAIPVVASVRMRATVKN